MNNVIVKEKYGCKGININFLKIYVLKFIDLKSEQLVLCFFFFFFFFLQCSYYFCPVFIGKMFEEKK